MFRQDRLEEKKNWKKRGSWNRTWVEPEGEGLKVLVIEVGTGLSQSSTWGERLMVRDRKV